MTHVFRRFPSDVLPTAVRGEGMYLIDAEGRRYLDGSGGAAVSALGHAHPRVLAAIHAQVDQLAFAHTYFFANQASEELAELLVVDAPRGIEKVYFLSGGSEATEAALKLARQYHVAAGEPSRSLFIHRRQSYHGNTLGALSVSGNLKRREIYEPILPAAISIAPCYRYRHQRTQETEQDYGRRAADELEEAIQQAGPGRVAAFIAEPIVGATLGAVPAAAGYFQRIQEICRRHGVLLILDEVMCGMGRSGEMFAASAFGVEPDMITVAKGLAGGYQPIGALLVNGKVFGQVTANRGHFLHGHTYSGHPVACAAALAVQQVIREDGLIERVRRSGTELKTILKAALGSHPHVGDIRGRGLLLGIELVADRASKVPFPASRGLARKIKAEAMAQGLVCYPGSGTADGTSGDHILLAPPYIIEPQHMAELADKLVVTLEQVLAP